MNDQIVPVVLAPIFILVSLAMMRLAARYAHIKPDATTPAKRRIGYGIFSLIILGSLFFGLNGAVVLQSERTVSSTCEIQHVFLIQAIKEPDYNLLQTTCGLLDLKQQLGITVATGVPYRITYVTAHSLFGPFTPEVKSISPQ